MTLENAKATAIKEQMELLKQKLTAAAQRKTTLPPGAVSAPALYPVIQQVTGQEEELVQRVQQLEAECLESSSQVEYLQARVLELEEIQHERARAKDQASALTKRITQLEVALDNSTSRVQELEAALDESVALVRKWEGAHSEGKARVKDLEAKVAHLNEHASQMSILETKLEEQSARIPQLEAQGAAAAAHAARVRELEEKHSQYSSNINNLGEKAKEDTKKAEAVHGDLKSQVVLLEKSNIEFQAALDLSSSRISELEAEALMNEKRTVALNAEVAQLEQTIQALKASQTSPVPSCFASPSPRSYLRRVPRVSGSCLTPAVAPPQRIGISPGSCLTPAAAPPRQIGISPIKCRISPLASHTSGLQATGPVLGACMSTGEPKTAAATVPAANINAPATSACARVVVPSAASSLIARPVQERRNGSIHHGQWETPRRYTNMQQPRPLIMRAVGS